MLATIWALWCSESTNLASPRNFPTQEMGRQHIKNKVWYRCWGHIIHGQGTPDCRRRLVDEA
jgi:hypothetical protein